MRNNAMLLIFGFVFVIVSLSGARKSRACYGNAGCRVLLGSIETKVCLGKQCLYRGIIPS